MRLVLEIDQQHEGPDHPRQRRARPIDRLQPFRQGGVYRLSVVEADELLAPPARAPDLEEFLEGQIFREALLMDEPLPPGIQLQEELRGGRYGAERFPAGHVFQRGD